MSFDFYTQGFYPEESYSRQLDLQVARDEMPYGYTTQPVLKEFHPYHTHEDSVRYDMPGREPLNLIGQADKPVPGLDQLPMDHPREHMAKQRQPKGLKLDPEFPIRNGHR
jgi:hypothetical protein